MVRSCVLDTVSRAHPSDGKGDFNSEIVNLRKLRQKIE